MPFILSFCDSLRGSETTFWSNESNPPGDWNGQRRLHDIWSFWALKALFCMRLRRNRDTESVLETPNAWREPWNQQGPTTRSRPLNSAGCSLTGSLHRVCMYLRRRVFQMRRRTYRECTQRATTGTTQTRRGNNVEEGQNYERQWEKHGEKEKESEKERETLPWGFGESSVRILRLPCQLELFCVTRWNLHRAKNTHVCFGARYDIRWEDFDDKIAFWSQPNWYGAVHGNRRAHKRRINPTGETICSPRHHVDFSFSRTRTSLLVLLECTHSYSNTCQETQIIRGATQQDISTSHGTLAIPVKISHRVPHIVPWIKTERELPPPTLPSISPITFDTRLVNLQLSQSFVNEESALGETKLFPSS